MFIYLSIIVTARNSMTTLETMWSDFSHRQTLEQFVFCRSTSCCHFIKSNKVYNIDMGEPSLTNHRWRTFVGEPLLTNHRWRTIVQQIFKNLRLQRLHLYFFWKPLFRKLSFKNLRKTFVPKVRHKIFKGFEIVSKNIWRF